MTNNFFILATKNLLRYFFLKKNLGPPEYYLAHAKKHKFCYSERTWPPKHNIILIPKFLNLKSRYSISINQFVYGHILQNHVASILLCLLIPI